MKKAALIVLGALIGTLLAHVIMDVLAEDIPQESPYWIEETIQK